VATTPKPRLVELEIAPQGEVPFLVGSYSHRAIHYVVTVKIGGVAGAIAPMVPKSETQMTDNALYPYYLGRVAIGDGLTPGSAQYKIAMGNALAVSHGHNFGG
jgi:hypothetical protein